MRECIEARVARLEIDVHSLDGADYIVSHERRFERETTGSGSVGAATPDDVRALRFLDDDGDRPPLLSEIVELARGSTTQLQLDLKDWRPLRDGASTRAARCDRAGARAGDRDGRRGLEFAAAAPRGPGLVIGFDPGRYLARSVAMSRRSCRKAIGAYGYRDDHPMAVGRTEKPADYLRHRLEILELQCPASREMFLDYRMILQMLDDGFDVASWLHERGSEVTAWTLDHTRRGVGARRCERLIERRRRPDHDEHATRSGWRMFESARGRRADCAT